MWESTYILFAKFAFCDPIIVNSSATQRLSKPPPGDPKCNSLYCDTLYGLWCCHLWFLTVHQDLVAVKELEIMSPKATMEWAIHLGFQKVVFEFDVEVVVDAIHSTSEDVTKFTSLVRKCKQLENTFSMLC